MTTKKEGPDKDDPRSDDGSKRPHAMLDLKAVEIKGAKGDDAKKAAAATSVPPVAASSGKPETRTESSAASQTTTPASADKSPGKSTGDTKPSPTTAAKPDATPPRARSGFGGFLSHMAAGIVGGFLALLGADTLGPIGKELGLPTPKPQWTEAAVKMEQRLATLEQAQRTTAADADLVDKIAATEGRLARLEQIDKELAAAREAQSRLATEAAALAERIDKLPAGGAPAQPDPRIAELESQLKQLAAAADANPNAGPIPQLAAIGGKVADLESSLASQIGALRQSFAEELQTKLVGATEASEAARAGVQRIDRQLAETQADAARIVQRMEALKADGDRLGQALRAAQEEIGQTRSALDALKGDVEARLAQVAKPADVNQAVAPVASKIGALEQSLQGIVKAESDRKTNAERILLSLELANLKRVVDRGQSYASELAAVSKTAGSMIDLSALARYEAEGVPTLPELADGFRPLAHTMLDAADEPADGSVIDRLLSGAKSVVKVRKVSHGADDRSPEAIVARMDLALKEARLGDVVAQAKELPPAALKPAEGWLSKVAARHAVDSALAAIEGQLKTSLAGSGAPSPKGTN